MILAEEKTFTIAPPVFRLLYCVITARVQGKHPSRLLSFADSKPLAWCLPKRFNFAIPALFTTMSNRPTRPTVSATIRFPLSSFATFCTKLPLQFPWPRVPSPSSRHRTPGYLRGVSSRLPDRAQLSSESQGRFSMPLP
jgi:hypothetical protein